MPAHAALAWSKAVSQLIAGATELLARMGVSPPTWGGNMFQIEFVAVRAEVELQVLGRGGTEEGEFDFRALSIFFRVAEWLRAVMGRRMANMDANAAFDAIQKIAQSSKKPADLESMKAQARAVIDQFQVAMSRSPRAIAERETRVLRQYLDGVCKTKRVDAVETPGFMEARDRLIGEA